MTDIARPGIAVASPPVRGCVALALGAIAAHLLMLWLPFVNEEGAFNSAAEFFRSGDVAAIQRYFNAEANTVVVAALGSFLSSVFNVAPDYGCRLLSILCIGVLAAAIWSMASTSVRSASLALPALILLNPVVWTFAGRGTADFVPMSLAAGSIALFWRARTSNWVLVSAILIFALAALTKYHVVLLLPMVALSPDESQTPRFRAVILGCTTVVSMVALVSYNIAIFDRFGFWITPPQFAMALSPTITNFFNNLIRYGGYLALLAFPFSLRSAFSRSTTLSFGMKVAIIAVVFGIGFALPPSAGEMNFGPFDRWVGDRLSGAVLAAMFAILILSFIDFDGSRIDFAVIASVLLFLIVLSVSRPAQRYLILVLPFYYLHLARDIDVKRWFSAVIATIVVLNVFIAVSQNKFGIIPSPGTAFGPARH
jgi:hypothetical protein